MQKSYFKLKTRWAKMVFTQKPRVGTDQLRLAKAALTSHCLTTVSGFL